MKQPDLFLELARRLAGEEADFVMAGHAEPGPLLTAVRAAHNELPSFQYGGPVTLTQANALFAEADLFISTSGSRPEYAEGLPNTFVQACLHATPILSLQHDPDRLISDNHIGEIAKSLDELTEKTRSWIRDNDKRRETGSRAYELATQRFNIETIVDQLLEAVKER